MNTDSGNSAWSCFEISLTYVPLAVYECTHNALHVMLAEPADWPNQAPGSLRSPGVGFTHSVHYAWHTKSLFTVKNLTN